MNEKAYRELTVENGTVECRPGVRVGLTVPFCASSRAFLEGGDWRNLRLAYMMPYDQNWTFNRSPPSGVLTGAEGFRSM